MVNPQVTFGPVITPGSVEVTFNTNVLAVPVPHTLVAATVTFPAAVVGLDTVIAVVVLPAVIVIPAGTVHVYPVAPADAAQV